MNIAVPGNSLVRHKSAVTHGGRVLYAMAAEMEGVARSLEALVR